MTRLAVGSRVIAAPRKRDHVVKAGAHWMREAEGCLDALVAHAANPRVALKNLDIKEPLGIWRKLLGAPPLRSRSEHLGVSPIVGLCRLAAGLALTREPVPPGLVSVERVFRKRLVANDADPAIFANLLMLTPRVRSRIDCAVVSAAGVVHFAQAMPEVTPSAAGDFTHPLWTLAERITVPMPSTVVLTAPAAPHGRTVAVVNHASTLGHVRLQPVGPRPGTCYSRSPGFYAPYSAYQRRNC